MTAQQGGHEKRGAAPSDSHPGSAPGSHPGFAAEFRDAVTPRAALMVIGVLLVQLGFIASYLGALLLGANGTDRLLVASAAGASVSQALTAVVQAVESPQRRTLRTDDNIPAGPGDARGLSAFYLVVGWVVGGCLVAAILGIGGGALPANRHRATIRLMTLTLYAVASGFGGAILAETIRAALSGTFFPLWAFGALVVLAVGALTMAAQVVLGIIGIGLAIVLFVVLGNPSASSAYPAHCCRRSGPGSGRGCHRGPAPARSAGWSTSVPPGWPKESRSSRRTRWAGLQSPSRWPGGVGPTPGPLPRHPAGGMVAS